MKYVHSPLGEDVEFLAGSYHIDQEERLPVDGRQVLYLLGQTSTITSCCGAASPFSFVKVVGYVNSWRDTRDEKGLPVSEVETIRGEKSQASIRDLIRRKHPDIDPLHIEFW